MAADMMVENVSCTVAVAWWLKSCSVAQKLAPVGRGALLQELAAAAATSVAIRTRKPCSSGFNLGWHFFPLAEQTGCLVKFEKLHNLSSQPQASSISEDGLACKIGPLLI